MQQHVLIALLLASVVACAPPEEAPKEELPETTDTAAVVAMSCAESSSSVYVAVSSDPLTFCARGFDPGESFAYGYPRRGRPDRYREVVRGTDQADETGLGCVAARELELEVGTYYFWMKFDDDGQQTWACAPFDVRLDDREPPDACANVACENGTCTAGVCACNDGFALQDGICVEIPEDDPCDGIACENGTCSAGLCQCDTGYTGTLCDDCAAGYSMEGGVCVPDAPPPPPPPPPSGWPAEIPAPFAGWDVMPASSTVMSAPGGQDASFSCTGSPGNLAGLTADQVISSGADGIITVAASYCVIHDITFEGYTVRVSGNHFVVRDVEINGQGLTTKTGLRLSGNDTVAYRNYVHHLMGNDRHCFTNGQGSIDSWFIENEGYACSGDGYQAGHRAQASPPTNVYLVRNHFHENRENGLDYKFMENVWAIENTLHGFVAAQAGTWCFPDDPTICSTSNSGSDGTAIVIGSDGAPTNTHHYRNTIYDSGNAIRVESAAGTIHIEGNVQYDITNRCLALDKDGIGIQYIGNTCRNAGRGIFQNWRVGFSLDVVSNTFEDITGPAIEYETGSVGEASTLVNNTFTRTGPVIYNNVSASDAAAINALPGASGNVVN